MKAVLPADSARCFPGRLKNSFLPGLSTARAVLLLILFCAALGAFGAERSGSTFTPGTLGDFGVAVVSTNPGLDLRNDMFYYQGTDARTMRNGQIKLRAATPGRLWRRLWQVNVAAHSAPPTGNNSCRTQLRPLRNGGNHGN